VDVQQNERPNNDRIAEQMLATNAVVHAAHY